MRKQVISHEIAMNQTASELERDKVLKQISPGVYKWVALSPKWDNCETESVLNHSASLEYNSITVNTNIGEKTTAEMVFELKSLDYGKQIMGNELMDEYVP